MNVLIFLSFVVSSFSETGFSSTEATGISTISLLDSNFTDENVTEFEFYNETTTIQPIYKIPVQPRIQSTSEMEYCTCDLQANSCDLNCCCDIDCSHEDKEVFEYCKVEPRYYDTRYCDYMKYIYINNTRFQWTINQNGLFCIIKSNKPPFYISQKKHPLKTFEESEYEKENKFSWPNYAEENDSFSSSKQFIYGSPVWYVDPQGLKKFGVPNGFITNRCLIKENVFYLKPLHVACTQADVNERNPQLNLRHYTKNLKFVSNPNHLNVTKYKDNLFENCPKNICLSVTPKVCDKSFSNCVVLLRNDTRFNIQCNLSIRDKMKTCINLVHKLQFNFYHNGTKGLTMILLLVILDQISYELGTGVPEINQEFFVNFFWTNSTSVSGYSSLSGNPGYIIGRPIMIGTLLTVKNGTESLLKIERNYTEESEMFLTIPKNINGDCTLFPSEYLRVEFGYNVLNQCKFSKYIYNNKTNINASELCKNLQTSLFKLWNLDSNKMVGLFGNANIKNFDEWQKILYKMHPETILNSTFGIYFGKNSTGFCKNIVTNLHINIFHSRIDIGSLINQEKILGVAVYFDDSANRTILFKKNGNYLSFNTDLQTRVTFYDLTAKKEKKFVDPPKLEINLPYDFFYPFVRINNSSSYVTINFLVVMVFFMFVLF